MIDFNTWEHSNINDMLNLLVGKEYGQDPQNRITEIQHTKYYESQNIKKHLELSENDRVIDLGSGCGFIANFLAPEVEHLNCIDISKSFLDYARLITQQHSNVSYHLIPFADLSEIKTSTTAIYSVAVFIHFNLYDCYLYLEQCYNHLEPQGRMFFDILNDSQINIVSERWQRQSARYFKDRTSIFTNVHYNNPNSVMDISRQIGFKVEKTYNERDHTFMLLRKPG